MVNDRPPGPGSGTEVYAGRLARALAARGHEVEWFLPDHPRRGLARAGDVWDPFVARRLRARARHADVVHVHNFARELSPSVVGAAHRPTVVTVHDHRLFHTDHPDGARSITGRVTQATTVLARRAVRRHADVVLAVSDELRDRLERVDIAPVTVVPPFADRFDEVETMPAMTAVFAGRLTEGKGVGVLLDAFSGVLERRPDARLEVAGEGPLRARVDEAPEVRARGVLDEADVRTLLAGARLVCVPSVDREGLPLVLVEAMLSGAAIVAADQPSIRTALAGGRAGMLVPPGDAGALRDALLDLLDDHARADSLGRAARDRAEQRFTTDRCVQLTEAAYARARARHG
jgi:glycosyltransferase involved in cell wall biosynthesis